MIRFKLISCLACVLLVSLLTNAACPKDFHEVSGKCYHVLPTRTHIKNQQQNCRGKGGYLAQVHSQADLDALKELGRLKKPPFKSWTYALQFDGSCDTFWLGGIKCKNKWIWTKQDIPFGAERGFPNTPKYYQDQCWLSGTAVTFTNWGKGEPGTRETGIEMRSNYEWNDRDCTDNTCAICQADPT